MASVKLASLIIRTLSKPIANQIKQQAQQHETFRQVCISFAQWQYRSEMRLRTSLLGESPKSIKPLSETRAVQNGANSLAEGFLFAVAAGLILGETWRSSRSQAKRRDKLDDLMEELEANVQSLKQEVESLKSTMEDKVEEMNGRHEELATILDRVIYIGLRGGWTELKDTPLKIPRDILFSMSQDGPASASSLSPPASESGSTLTPLDRQLSKAQDS